MKTGSSSRTAAYAAFLRALGDRGMTSADGFHDEAARTLLSPSWSGLFRLGSIVPRLPRRVRERIVAHVDLFVTRALAIDAEVIRSLDAGCRQVVVLGAGFDSRAHRMPALDAVRVFEVDHPATQLEKQRRAAGLARTCRELTYVACDFGRDHLADRLRSAGHRADAPTLWIWEGVTLYLDDAALRTTLDALAACSSPRSTLVVEYHDAAAPKVYSLYSVAREILLALWSEQQIGSRSQHAMRSELERAGFRVDNDFGLFEWGATAAGVTSNPRSRRARLAVATMSARAEARFR